MAPERRIGYLGGEGLWGGEGGGGVPLVGGALTTVRHLEAAFEAMKRAVWEARGGGHAAAAGSGAAAGASEGAAEAAAAAATAAAQAAAHALPPAPAANDALEAWRLTSPEYAAFVEARKGVKELRTRYSAAALRVNEAKRSVDAALAASAAAATAAAAGGGGLPEEHAKSLATRLLEAKAAPKRQELLYQQHIGK